MALLDSMGQYLQDQTASLPSNQQLTLGGNLFLGRFPAEAPNAAVLIQQYGGGTPTMTMGSAPAVIENPKLQLSFVVSERTTRMPTSWPTSFGQFCPQWSQTSPLTAPTFSVSLLWGCRTTSATTILTDLSSPSTSQRWSLRPRRERTQPCTEIH